MHSQNVQLKGIKDAVWEIFGYYSIEELPKTPAEFMNKFEDYDFSEFFRKELETLDDEEAPTDDRDDDDYLDLDAKFSILERFYNLSSCDLSACISHLLTFSTFR